MAKDDELKESVKKPIKDLVKEIVKDTVSKLVKASAQKSVIALRDRLKEEAAHRLEETLRETTEKRLEQTAKELEKDFTRDAAEESEYLENVEKQLSKGLEKCLPPVKAASPLITIVLSCACLLLIWVGVYCCWLKPIMEPRPDLVINQIEPEWTDSGVVIHYLIANQGDAEAGGSCTHMYIGEDFLLADCVMPLAAGEEREQLFPAYPLSEDDIYARMMLCVDGDRRIEESNEENNCVTIESNIPLE